MCISFVSCSRPLLPPFLVRPSLFAAFNLPDLRETLLFISLNFTLSKEGRPFAVQSGSVTSKRLFQLVTHSSPLRGTGVRYKVSSIRCMRQFNVWRFGNQSSNRQSFMVLLTFERVSLSQNIVIMKVLFSILCPLKGSNPLPGAGAGPGGRNPLASHLHQMQRSRCHPRGLFSCFPKIDIQYQADTVRYYYKGTPPSSFISSVSWLYLLGSNLCLIYAFSFCTPKQRRLRQVKENGNSKLILA